MNRRRELQYKQLCEQAQMIERAREAGNLDHVAALLELFRASCALSDIEGTTDSHQLEALADYTPDAAEAVQLYKRAMALSRRRQEPTFTKRIWMAARLMELGANAEARTQLIEGRAEAERLRADGAVAYADELLAQFSSPTTAVGQVEAIRIATDHTGRIQLDDRDYRMEFELVGMVGNDWLFAYRIRCLKDILPKKQERFAGAGGFLVSVAGEVQDLSVPMFIQAERKARTI